MRGPCDFEGIQSGATPESPLLPAQKSGRRLCLSLGKRGKHARSRRAAKAHPAASARHAGEGLPVPYGAPLQHVAALRGGNESTGGLPRPVSYTHLERGSAAVEATEKRELLVRFAVEKNPVLEGWGNKIVIISDGE